MELMMYHDVLEIFEGCIQSNQWMDCVLTQEPEHTKTE